MASMTEVLAEVQEIAGEAVLELRRARQDRERAARQTPEADAELAAMRDPLHQMDFTAALLRRAPGFAKVFEREIPEQFWTVVGRGEVDVACPCGETPTAVYAVPQPCECGRAFLFTGERVMVAFTPSGETPSTDVD